jgi:hypothetical protein
MNDLITLELKQNQSGNVNANGDYNTILTTPIDIMEGDEISISKVFIDTAAEEQSSIDIPEDLIFTFSGHIYNTNWNTEGKTFLADTIKDCKKYVLCTGSTAPVEDRGELIESVNFELNYLDAGHWGGLDTIWQYVDFHDQTIQYHLKIPEKTIIPYDKTTFFITVDVGIISKPDTFFLVSPSPATIAGAPYYANIASITKEEVEGGTKIFTPTLYTKRFLVEKGSYTPTYFAKYVTDNLIRNEYNTTNPGNVLQPSKNEFLLSSNNISTTQIFIDSESGTNGFTYPLINPPVGGYWVGSSQLSLQFAENRFYWSNLHMPIYDTGGNACIKYITPIDGESEVIAATNNSGVFWNSITTNSNDPKYINFFKNVLAFDFTKTTPTYTTILRNIGTESGYVHLFKWNDYNWTGALNSIDTGVVKNLTFYTIQNASALVTLTSETQGIYANDIFSIGNGFGYYQIEINSVFKNLLIGTDIKQNISAIVSRYYESNSYASGTSQDAISYFHKGTPVQLSSIGVRILDSNGNLASSIGSDNSIYLQVIKAQQPPPDKK